jgi:hypothetical protein
MTTAYLMEWPRIKQKQYETLVRALNWYGKFLSGSAVHVPGPLGGSLVVMEVWESREASTHFLTSLFAQALQKAGLPQPVIQSWDIPAAREPAPAMETVEGQRVQSQTRQRKNGPLSLQLSTVNLN